jgi:DNA sulfur modification protein DndD
MTFKILRFKAENFRSLRNIDFELSTDSHKPLTVIRAENGSGKTTILEAMKWCLFGDRALPRKRGEYPMIPSDWDTIEGKDTTAIVATEMIFQITSSLETRAEATVKYRIRRECAEKYDALEKANVTTSENVFLYKTTQTGMILQEDAEQQIEFVILRHNLKDVFFTDGDAVNAQISSSSPSERADFVRNTVKTLLGVEIIEKIDARLESQTRRIDRDIRKTIGAGDLSLLLDSIDTAKTKLDELNQKLVEVVSKRNGAQKVYDERERDLLNCLASGGQDRKNLLNEYEEAKKRLDHSNIAVSNAYKGFAGSLNDSLIAPVIASDAISRAQNILDKLKQDQIIPNYKPDLMKLILKNQECVCGSAVRDGNELEQHIRDVLTKFAVNDEVHTLLSDLNPVLSLLGQDIEHCVEDLCDRILTAEEGVASSLRAYRDSGSQIRKIEAEIARLQDTDLDIIEEEKRKAFTALQDFTRESGTLEEQIKYQNNALQSLEEKRKSLEKNAAELSSFSFAKEAINDLSIVIRQVLSMLNGETLVELSQELNRLFLLMTSGDNGVSKFAKAELDRDYCIWVYLSDGKRQDPRDLSGAERRAYVLSFIFAAVNISKEYAPCIIDTPLGMASGELKRQMLLQACRNSKQLVLFLTRAEIFSVEDILDEYCGTCYTMSNTGDYPAKLAHQPDLPGKQSVICNCSYNDLVGCPACKRKGVRI